MDSNIVASSPFLRLAGLWTRDLPFHQTSILFSYRDVGRSEIPEGGHYVLKWGFTWTFSGNKDATKK